MCTVTYIPTKEKGFIFTSNRDEAPKRTSLEVVNKVIQGKAIVYPRDAQANGTWIAISNTGQLVCILNGAFEKHERKAHYKMSRGIMALDFFKYANATTFFEEFDFDGIEPFTMIIVDDGKLYDFKWDESKQHIQQLDTADQHIWSSCTLYSKEWQQKRSTWFAEWQRENPNYDQGKILAFHKNGGENNVGHDLVMDRENVVRTVSITSIVKDSHELQMRYEDLINAEVVNKELSLV